MPSNSDTSQNVASQRAKVIYILGWGHSGSTLLDLTIGTAPDVVSIGEIIFFKYYQSETPHHKVLKDFECTCGRKLNQCEFWSGVLRRAEPTIPNIVYDESGFSRLRWVARLVWYRLTGRRSARVQVGDDELLFRSVLEEAGDEVTFVSDSSKDFARLARLLMQPGIEVFPVFLVRDVRAVSSSYSKKVRAELGLNKVSYFRATVLWTLINLMSWFVVKVSGRPTYRVSYDRFCRDPKATIRGLAEFLEVRLDPEKAVSQISQSEYHNVGGNLMRFKKIEEIRYDDSWKARNPRWKHWIALGMAGIFNLCWVSRDSTKRS